MKSKRPEQEGLCTSRKLVRPGCTRQPVAGTNQVEAPESAGTAYQTREADLGRCLVPSLDDISEALVLAEGEHIRLIDKNHQV